MIILLIYTATYVPVRTAFIDKVSPAVATLEYTVDALFGLDLIFNFMSAYTDVDRNLEIRPQMIALNYIKSWFAFDAFACIPFQVFEASEEVLEDDLDHIGALGGS